MQEYRGEDERADRVDVAEERHGARGKAVHAREIHEGYVTRIGLDKDDQVIGYEFVNLGKMMEDIKNGMDANEAVKKHTKNYGRYNEAVKKIDPRKE